MYDADYEEFMQEQNDRTFIHQAIQAYTTGQLPAYLDKEYRVGEFKRYNPSEGKYETKDSGKRFESPDGMVRDTSEGKPQFTLMFPKDIPFEDQLMTRVADLYHRGGVKYGPRNWEKSSTEEALAKHEDCLMRHVVKFLLGVEDGEDHAAAIVWNVNAVDLTRWKLKNTLPNGPVQQSIDEFLDDPSKGVRRGPRTPLTDEEFIAKTNSAVAFPKVEFAQGDELLDKNRSWWKLAGNGFWVQQGIGTTLSWINLVKGYTPLYIQTGAYAGITVLKDGGITHDE